MTLKIVSFTPVDSGIINVEIDRFILMKGDNIFTDEMFLQLQGYSAYQEMVNAGLVASKEYQSETVQKTGKNLK
jgi:hypothetical protein